MPLKLVCHLLEELVLELTECVCSLLTLQRSEMFYCSRQCEAQPKKSSIYAGLKGMGWSFDHYFDHQKQ